MQAHVNGTVIAEAPEAELVKIEGNWYFPPSSIVDGFLTPSPTPYTCPWKGACQYFTVTVDGKSMPDRAWSYPNVQASGVKRVGTDFSNYVAFTQEVKVSE
jgi:uncharacterized protein (DUF427 family)